MNKFFLLKCEFDTGDINNEFVSEYLNQFLTTEDFENSFIVDEEIVDENVDLLYCVFDEVKVDKMIEILNDEGFFMSKTDITSDVLLDNIDKYIGLNKVPFLEEFRFENITKDIILDKIIEKGFESLSDFEKEIING